MHDYEEGTKGAAIYGMSHRDLLDLQYAVNKAVGLAREALGSSATELT